MWHDRLASEYVAGEKGAFWMRVQSSREGAETYLNLRKKSFAHYDHQA